MNYDNVPKFLVLALAYYRAPLRYPALSDGRRDLPPLVDGLLSAFADTRSKTRLAESAERLGCSSDELQAAALFFIRQVLFAKGGNHYRVLGLSRDASVAKVKEHYRLIIRQFHPDRSSVDEEWSQIYAPRINEAYNVLRNPEKRAAYDASLGLPVPRGDTSLRPQSDGEVSRALSRRRRNRNRHRRGTKERETFRLLPWAVGASSALVMLVLIVSILSRGESALRADPAQLEVEVPGPSFLSQREGQGTSLSSDIENTPTESAVLESGDEPPLVRRPAEEQDSGHAPAPGAPDASLGRSPVPGSSVADGRGDAPDAITAIGDGFAEAGGIGDADLESGWVVQVASYSDRAKAAAMIEQLKDAGFEGFLEEVRIVRTQYRVRVGPEAYRQEAEKLRVVIGDSLQIDGQIRQYP